MRSSLNYFLSFVVIFSVCWNPINRYIIPFDAAGRLVLLLLTICCFIISPFISHIIKQRPINVYTILVLYIFINALIKGTNITGLETNTYIIFCQLFNPLFLFYIVVYLSKINYDKTLALCATSLIIYTLLCLLNETSSVYEGRMGSQINPNTIALNASIAYLMVLFQYIRKRMSLFFLCLVSLPTLNDHK